MGTIIWCDDNPAGRLYGVFRQFRGQEGGISLDDAWARTLKFDANDISRASLYLAELASTVQQCVVAANSLSHIVNVSELLIGHSEWARAIIGFGMDRRAGISPAQVLSATAVALLGTMSGLLHIQAPEISWKGAPPGEEEWDDVRIPLQQVVNEIQIDKDIPESTKAHVLRKLHQVLETITLIELRGAQRLLTELSEASASLEATAQGSEDSTVSWAKKMRAAAEHVEAATKSVLSMIGPVAAVTVLIVTGNLQLALFILAADPKGHPALEALKGIWKPKGLTEGSSGK